MKCVLLLGATGIVINGPIVRLPKGVWKFSVEGSYERCSVIVNETSTHHLEHDLILLEHSDVTCVVHRANELTIRIERPRAA